MIDAKFRFTKILEISKMKLDNEKTKLQHLQDRKKQIRQMLEAKRNSILVAQNKADSEEFVYDPRVHNMQLQYIEALENEFTGLVALDEKADQALEIQQEAIANAYKEFKTFDKMKEYHEEAAKTEAVRHDQKLIDEHNSIQHAQKKYMEGDS